MADHSAEDELLLADIAVYLDAHEPLQALWGVSDSGDTALLGALSDCADIDALLDADAPPTASTAPAANITLTSESSQEQQHHPAAKTTKAVRNVTRERQQRELKELREQYAELEQRLAELQQQQTKREAPNVVSSAQQKLLLATWKRIAQRQLELRTLAEIENWRLKQQTEAHRMIASSMQQSLHQWTAMEPPASLTSRPSSSYAPRPTHIAMQPCDTIDSVDVEIITNLAADLDAEYLRMDHVLRENGLIHWQVASKTSTMHMKTRCRSNDASMRDKESSSLYIEFMEADVIPFNVEMVFKVAWQCWQRRRIPESSGVYERISYLEYDDPTTIIAKMRFKVFVNGESVELDAYCVLKAYVEEQGRISTVLRAITKADDHFPGVYIDETDWQLMKPMQEVRLPGGSSSTPSTLNATALFACAHMESRQFGGGGHSDLVDMNSSPLAKLTASTYEVDTDHVSDMMMNMLLQERSSSSCVATSDAQGTVGYVRHLS